MTAKHTCWFIAYAMVLFLFTAYLHFHVEPLIHA